MSSSSADLCSLMIRESFGDVVQKVSDFILRNGPSALKFIGVGVGLKANQVKKALCTLIQHNLLTYEENKKGQVEYCASTEHILMRIRYPQFIYSAKTLYGDSAELIVEELLENGQLQMSAVVPRVKDRLSNEESSDKDKVSIHTVKENFVYLAKTHFIQRCPVVDPTVTVEPHHTTPHFVTGDVDVYQIPNVDLESLEKRKRKRSVEDDLGQPSKRRKVDEEKLPDEDICWRVNFDRFNQYLRDQNLVSAVGRKIDKKAAEVMRTMLRLSEIRTDQKAPVSNPISYNEIFQAMPKELSYTRAQLDQYLKLLTEDSIEFITKAGDSGGGMYCMNFQKAFQTLAKSHIESVIQERFGSKCLRIFRLLLLKKHLEQKQIEECAMIPAKEAKEMLYTMFGENFIYLTEVPRTPDYAPSRTFYLFSVDLNQVSRMVLERCYKALYNLMLRREHEVKDHRRILEKQQRVEAIMVSLEQQGADSQQKVEIEEMITPAERTQLAKVKHITNKLEQSEAQLDSTIFVLNAFLKYEHTK